ncbi:MAG: hypothetical protein QXU40_01550 [Candidatus Pacearchaeota archaeon]
MSVQDVVKIKEKIISIIAAEGPTIPIRISKKIEKDLIFTSAFLSELVSEKKIKMSHMRVGSSPLYFIEGQEPLLEKFSEYLRSKEREAFMLLKERKFLDDSEQDAAIRVALREIKDFAIPLRTESKLFWRFFTVPEQWVIEQIESSKKLKEVQMIPKSKVKMLEIQKSSPEQETTDKSNKGVLKKPKKRGLKNKIQNKENKFTEKVKNFLSEKSIEILEIIGFGKEELILKVKEKNNEEKIIIAYNKKKINENDIIKASKKASEFGLPYIIVSLGEPLRKISEIVSASKNLHSIEKLK